MLEALTTKVNVLESVVIKIEGMIQQKNETIKAQDVKISELEAASHDKQGEIDALKLEVRRLKDKNA